MPVSQAEQDRRLEHAIVAHGLNVHDCDGPGCGPVLPLSTCRRCNGHGHYYTFADPRRCGPRCPLGNPQ